MAYCCSSSLASISEEVLGFGRELPTESEEGEEPTPRAGGKDLGPRTRPTAPAVEQYCPEVEAGRLLLAQYIMADKANAHPTDGRRRKEKGPPSNLALPRLERVSDTEREHSEDSAGEKEAKRQRSNPGTPVSTPRRMPYDYDAMMGINKSGNQGS